MIDLLPEGGYQDLATKSDLGRVEESLRADIRRVEGSLAVTQADVARIAVRLDDFATKEEIARIDDRMGRLEKQMEKFDDRLHGLHNVIHDQTRHYIVACSSSMLVVAAIAFGAARLT